MDYFLLTAAGKSAGPYSLAQLRAFWANGQVTLDTPCWSEDMGWKSVRAIADKINPPPLPYVPTVTPTKSSGLALEAGAVGIGTGLAHKTFFKSSSSLSSGLAGLAAAQCFYQANGSISGAIRRFILAAVRALIILAILLAIPFLGMVLGLMLSRLINGP
jgi:hypothetical protein